MYIDDRQLECFREIARHRSIKRAAVHLNISQPALSRRMRSLEHQIGAELFVRSRAGVDLTPAGRRLLERSRFLSDAIEDIGEFAQKNDGAAIEPRRVGLGISPGASHFMVERIVQNWYSKSSTTVLHLVEGVAKELRNKVLDDELQVALVTGDFRSPFIECRPIWKEQMFLVSPKWQKGPLPFAMPTRDAYMKSMIERELQRLGKSEAPHFELHSPPLIKRLIAAGLAYSIFPYSAVYEEVADGSMRCARLESLWLPRVLLSHKSRRQHGETQAVLELVQQVARDLLAESNANHGYLCSP